MDDLGLDPELAALLDNSPAVLSPQIPKKTLFSTSLEASGVAQDNENSVDLTVRSFETITHFFEETPHTVFDDPAYYKKVLGNENESAQRLHTVLSRYVTCQDPKDRGVYRQQLITAYWDFASNIAIKTGSGRAEPAKRLTLRFGLLLPSLLTPEQKTMFAKIIDKKTTREAVFYLDEWFREIGAGKINPSSTDEAKTARKDESSRFQQLLNKAEGKLQSAENLLRAKSEEKNRAENEIRQRLESIFQHASLGGFSGIQEAYTDVQKKALVEIVETLKNLLSLDKELVSFIRDYESADSDVKSLQQKVDASGGGQTNTSGISAEFDTIRQMAKMTCGRQGNHFPILTREYFHASPREIGIRENVIETLRWIESIDPEAYCRIYKSQLNRIPPFAILIPSYGDYGFCWEPFDRYNRITSRGRIAVPMYSKNLQLAVLTAIADLRWQVAKEKASYYWMEEGLTGNYYQWFQTQKLKGDVKEYFINDYVMWILKESDGIQKLDKVVRGVFWRYMPFPQEIKAKLKTRALVYQELCQRDANREMSDGY